ncbi:hypothetical protein [Vannielia sp.]|uniref:hypothetical protein n=1 Tax=Vannielia sp. TaxID=2813045 RepID=UPI0026152BB3|nr:hypothetical protein [Vannielia sp.]MDF1871238.1 hypothetical protein [Vannielia sp.]
MAQHPATPKAKRLALRAAAALLGPRTASRLLHPTPSEQAALTLRATPRQTAPANPTVTFLIPLVGRHHVSDWSAVEARLTATLASFTAQTAPNWQAVICGQDAPSLPDDPRFTFLPFTEPTKGNDKWRKLAQLSATLPRLPHGYAMPFDADDLLAPTAVAEMTARKSASGYLVTTGWVYDAGTKGLALASPQSLRQPGQKAFWKLCGSCAAFRHSATAEEAAFLTALTQHEHRMFPYLAALAGRRLTPLRAPATLYILNHGENFGARRGRVSFKTRFVTRFPAKNPSDVLARFPMLAP